MLQAAFWELNGMLETNRTERIIKMDNFLNVILEAIYEILNSEIADTEKENVA